MTFVVTDACIKCKYTDCVEVCPVDCFYEGENTLVIHPDECIEMNRQYAEQWPVITMKKDPLPTAEEFKDIQDKMDLLSPNPGEGD